MRNGFDATLALESARTAAQREVARLLATPEDLSRLESIRAEASGRRAAAESALSSALGAQVGETLRGRGGLGEAGETLGALRAVFAEVDALCAECGGLVSHDAENRQLATVRVAFGATLTKAVDILDLPEEAARTLAELAAERQLVVVFEELVALDAKCLIAQRLFDAGGGGAGGGGTRKKARNEELKARVASYFSKVDAARATFEERLWRTLRRATHEGEAGAAALVRCVHVVEEQEAMDAERFRTAAFRHEAAAAAAAAAAAVATASPPREGGGGGGAGGRAAPRMYRAQALQALEQSVDERAAKLLPFAFEPGTDGEVSWEEVLHSVTLFFRGLEDVYDHASPCFPPSYQAWEVLARRTHARLVQFFDRLAAQAAMEEGLIGNADILAVVRLHEEYLAMARELAVPDEWVAIQAVPQPPPAEAGGGGPRNAREAVAAAEEAARARAKQQAAAAGGNWEGAAVVPVDEAARALLKGIAIETVGLTAKLGAGVASGTLGALKGVGNLVQAGVGLLKGRGGGGGGEAAPAEEAPAEAPRRVPSAELWAPGMGGGLGKLFDMYVARMRDATSAWMSNMVAADLALPPQEEEGGRLWTPAGVDFFRIVNEQLEAITEVTRGELLLRAVVAISKLMLDFQRLQNEAVQRPAAELSLELLCAYVNNNERAFDLSNEVLEGLREGMEDPAAAARLEVLTVTDQGFLDTARAAMTRAVDAVMSDAGLLTVFSQLFSDPGWWSGDVCATLCATVDDYCADLQRWLSDAFFKRTAEALMERTVGAYCAAFLLQCRGVKTDTMSRMAEDEAALRAVFGPLVKPSALAASFATLADLRDLASASTEREVQAAFGTALAHAPGLGVELVERVLSLRDDIPKPVRRQIVAACAEQQARRAPEGAPAARPGATAVAQMAEALASKGGKGRSWSAFGSKTGKGPAGA